MKALKIVIMLSMGILFAQAAVAQDAAADQNVSWRTLMDRSAPYNVPDSSEAAKK